MEMRLGAPVTRGYFFLLGALRLVNAASPRSIDQKKISSGTKGNKVSVVDELERPPMRLLICTVSKTWQIRPPHIGFKIKRTSNSYISSF